LDGLIEVSIDIFAVADANDHNDGQPFVHDHDHLSVRPGVTQKHSQEHLERLGVKRRNRESDEAAVGRTDRSDRTSFGGRIDFPLSR